MNMQEIRGIAKQMGITSSNKPKTELIRLIQASEGNFECFATARDGTCDQLDCLWRKDCFAMSRRTH